MDLARDLQSKGHYRNYSCPIIKASCKSSIDKTSDISISSTQIERLRKRKLKSIELCEIQPETVAKVVKSYLLPMIKYKCSSKFENTSLVSHFTVIENLQNENEHLNTLLNELRERDKLLAQERYEYLEEVNRLNNLNIDYQTHIKFLNNTFTQTIKNTRRVEKQLEFSKYHKTRAQINKLQVANYELEHLYNLVVEENLILKDRGCGIEKSLQHLTSSLYSERFESEDEKNLFDLVKSFILETFDLKDCISTLQIQSSSIKERAIKEHDSFVSQLQEKDQIISKYKEKVGRLERALNFSNTQIDSLRCMLDKTKKDLDLLNHEYVMARRRISMLQPAAAEKICVNCKKAFKDEENFNWSCKVHLSEYSGNAWWCCGKSDKGDEGCSITKHVTKDDNEEDPQNKFILKGICSSCKEKGHSSFNCPKDPNIKTSNEVFKEVVRMESLAADKLTKKMSVSDVNENLKKGSFKHFNLSDFKPDSIKACQFSSFSDIEDIKQMVLNKSVNFKKKTSGFSGADKAIDSRVFKKKRGNNSVVEFFDIY